MAIGINLMPELGKEEKKRAGLIRKVYFSTGIVILVFIVIIVGVFTYRSILSGKLDDLDAEAAEIEASINTDSLREVEANLLGIKSKLNFFEDFKSQQLSYADVLQDLGENYFPKNVTVLSLEVDAVDQQIDFSGNASTYEDLAGLLEKLSGEVEESEETQVLKPFIYEDVLLSSISRTETGEITFRIGLTVKEGSGE